MWVVRSLLAGRAFSAKLPVPGVEPPAPLSVPLTGVMKSQSGIYAMFFTCKVCNTRSGKTFSKDAYHKGVVIIRCDGCQKLHLVADNLGWFRDKKVTVEDLAREKGEEMVKLAQEKPVLEYVLDEESRTS